MDCDPEHNNTQMPSTPARENTWQKIPPSHNDVVIGECPHPAREERSGKSEVKKDNRKKLHKRKQSELESCDQGTADRESTGPHAMGHLTCHPQDLGQLILEGFKNLTQLLVSNQSGESDEPVNKMPKHVSVESKGMGRSEDALDQLGDLCVEGCSVDEEEEEDEISHELKELEQFFNIPESYGEDLHASVAPLIYNGISTAVNKEKVKEVVEKHLCPQNTPNLRVPRVNPQVWRMLPAHAKTKDVQMQKMHMMMVKSVTITAKLFSVIIQQQKKGTIATKSVTPLITDLLRIGSAIYTDFSQQRREAVKPYLNDECKELCKPNEDSSTQFLFGDNLDESVKIINETMKLTKAVTKPRFDARSKNGQGRMFHPSSSRPHQHQRGGRGWRHTPRGERGGRRPFGRGQNQQH